MRSYLISQSRWKDMSTHVFSPSSHGRSSVVVFHFTVGPSWLRDLGIQGVVLFPAQYHADHLETMKYWHKWQVFKTDSEICSMSGFWVCHWFVFILCSWKKKTKYFDFTRIIYSFLNFLDDEAEAERLWRTYVRSCSRREVGQWPVSILLALNLILFCSGTSLTTFSSPPHLFSCRPHLRRLRVPSALSSLSPHNFGQIPKCALCVWYHTHPLKNTS